ncbi:MAG: hypothetical protein NXI04_05010 [Planctomycetaceae bacterium]|nr:hypothetical protein [Planctomycetaceae bacterium]
MIHRLSQPAVLIRVCLLTAVCGLVAASSATATAAPQASRVLVQKTEGAFQLICNGQPMRIKGVGGDTYLPELAAAGGNTIRTWASDKLGPVLDEAERHGLKVCAGLWLGHQRHGFDYENPAAVQKQLKEKLAFVRQHRDHPALLMWGVGNEMEGEGNDPAVWKAVNEVAREIKRLDPNHPTMTVIAELGGGENKVAAIERFCPDIDIVGINSYGGVETVGARYLKAGGTRPFIITEHGPLGPWEVGATAWGSPEEWTSTAKGEFYAKGYRANAVKRSDACLGTFAFLWGHKQETTATWFGMLLPDGSRLAAAETMSTLWTGQPPANRCPQIQSLQVQPSGSLKPGTVVQATLSVSDPEDAKLEIDWVLRSDSGTIGAGGDPQESESVVKQAVVAQGAKATVTMPEGGGGYRLFAYVRDPDGSAAVANVTLHVAAPMKLDSVMPQAELPYVVYADGSPGSVYVPSGYMGNAAAVKMELASSDNPHSGSTCLQAEYNNAAAWGGVLWQSPAEDWDGLKPGGANLTGATHLEFYARGDVGGETVNFVIGVLDGNQPYRDTAKGELKNVRLTKKWTRYQLPLEGLDLRRIKTGFGWSLAGQGKAVRFYLDDIRYIKEK